MRRTSCKKLAMAACGVSIVLSGSVAVAARRAGIIVDKACQAGDAA
jgi:hypothetical protein